ncbi:MAG: hypothetical protein ACJAV5_002046 [Vicingaceae bacterium]|jgi:hypothetical protein
MEQSCKNCGTTLKGSYCFNCGRRTISKRFTVKESIGWLLTNIFNLEKGFYTLLGHSLKRQGK